MFRLTAGGKTMWPSSRCGVLATLFVVLVGLSNPRSALGQQDDWPGGTWAQDGCGNATWNGNTLTAMCTFTVDNSQISSGAMPAGYSYAIGKASSRFAGLVRGGEAMHTFFVPPDPDARELVEWATSLSDDALRFDGSGAPLTGAVRPQPKKQPSPAQWYMNKYCVQRKNWKPDSLETPFRCSLPHHEGKRQVMKALWNACEDSDLEEYCAPVWVVFKIASLIYNYYEANKKTTGFIYSSLNVTASCAPGSGVVSTGGILVCENWANSFAFQSSSDWTASCTSWEVQSPTISGWCLTSKYYKSSQYMIAVADLQFSILNTTFCSTGEYQNYYGALVCSDGIATNRGFPGGSWYKACSPMNQTGNGVLSALCNTGITGVNQLSRVNVTLCQAGSGLVNVNGTLICNSVASGLPGGSWSQSCAPYSYQAAKKGGAMVLKAFCGLRNKNGTQMISTIQPSLCSSSEVSNHYGVLSCTANTANLPGGTWTKSCYPRTYSNGLLTARCNGVSAMSTVNYTLCSSSGGLTDVQGVLVCGQVNLQNKKGQSISGTWANYCAPQYWNSSSGILVAACGWPAYRKANMGPMALSIINTTLCSSNSATIQISSYYGTLVCTNGVLPSLPGGTWSQSCGPVAFPKSKMLVTQCGDVQYDSRSNKNVQTNSTVFKMLNYGLCVTGSLVSSNGGILVCQTSMSLPGSGSWNESCSPIAYKDMTLVAQCGAPWGRSEWTYMNNTKCANNNIYNRDGFLACTPPPPSPTACTTVAKLWNQCGGLSAAPCSTCAVNGPWTGYCCPAGSECAYVNPYYYQCQPEISNLPGGSWAQSCSAVVSWKNQILKARCGLPNRGVSTLNYALCGPQATVSVNNALLVCSQVADSLPGGVWTASCSPVSMSRTGTLNALCLNNSQIGVATTINWQQACSSSLVTNTNGFLKCYTLSPNIPGGSYLKSCSVQTWNSATGMLSAYCSDVTTLTWVNVSLCNTPTLTQYYNALVCTDGVLSNSLVDLPGGSWSETCAPISYVTSYPNNNLTAFCALPSNTPATSAPFLSMLDIETCGPLTSGSANPTLSNDYGVLVCVSS